MEGDRRYTWPRSLVSPFNHRRQANEIAWLREAKEDVYTHNGLEADRTRLASQEVPQIVQRLCDEQLLDVANTAEFVMDGS